MNKPKQINSLSKLKQSHWLKVRSPSGSNQYIPKLIDLNPDQIQQTTKKYKYLKYVLPFLLSLLFIILLLCSILIPLFILRDDFPVNLTNVSMETDAPVCIYPFVLNVDGRCVNIMIDSNNCGSIGNRCLNNSSCSAGVCLNVPGIRLNNSIGIWSSPVNGSSDDQMFNVTIPWNITLYNTTTNRVVVTTDGVLCLGNCSATYTETRLPSSVFGGATAFPYWDDLYIYLNTSQGIYYQSEGNSPTRRLIFEFYMSHYLQPEQFYHFQVLFFENSPGIVQYKYFEATDGGDTCTIGVQASPTGPFLLYAYDTPNSVQRNLMITFDTILQRFNQSTFT